MNGNRPGLLKAIILLALGWLANCASALEVGFGEADITPDLNGPQPVWLAGYGTGRQATGVHDPLLARCLVLHSGGEKIALVSVDLIGLQFPTVQKIRAGLTGFKYVLVASTHNHEGPDVIGIWGRGPLSRGVNDDYLGLVVERVIEAVRRASAALTPVTASYGTAVDETLLHDGRLPVVKDGVLRLVRFQKVGGKEPAGLLVQWNCHPEAAGSKNHLVTADFPTTTIQSLQAKYHCPIIYFSGAIGGLLAPPRGGRIGKTVEGKFVELREGDFEYVRAYGHAVADLAIQAADQAEPLAIEPFQVSTKTIAIPVENALYRAARVARIVIRDGYLWTGDFEKIGDRQTMENVDKVGSVLTEVAYLRMGDLHLACLPGELYPELVYGKFQNPVEPNVDFPTAALEPSVASILPGPKWLLFGLANDELGYIIPKRQWDRESPFAYGRERPQYGEINSCGPEVAPILLEALRRRVKETNVAP